jgi:acetate kinase
MNIFPGVPHVACFDTAFHSSIPDYAARFPFAEKFWNAGIRRYGFHGLSCESAVRGLGRELAPRTVLAHLGNGCSITALRNGVSMENTMGLTPTGGVMMGTRSGDLDPGVILHLLRNGYDSQKLDALLNHDSGLQGVSGVSSDMRSLLERSPVDSNAKLAIQMFCYSVRKSIGALATVLGGIEMLVFTGGIGEHAAPVRAEICSGLEHLGIELDDAANQRNAQKIASARSKCDVRIVEADEDLQIALHSARLYP